MKAQKDEPRQMVLINLV